MAGSLSQGRSRRRIAKEVGPDVGGDGRWAIVVDDGRRHSVEEVDQGRGAGRRSHGGPVLEHEGRSRVRQGFRRTAGALLEAVRVLAREIQNPLVRYRGHRRGLRLSELYDGIGCQRRSDEQSRKMFPGVAGDEKGPGPVSETRPRDRPRKMR